MGYSACKQLWVSGLTCLQQGLQLSLPSQGAAVSPTGHFEKDDHIWASYSFLVQ